MRAHTGRSVKERIRVKTKVWGEKLLERMCVFLRDSIQETQNTNDDSTTQWRDISYLPPVSESKLISQVSSRLYLASGMVAKGKWSTIRSLT